MEVQAAALSGWGLLVTAYPASEIHAMTPRVMSCITQLLDALGSDEDSQDMLFMCGETAALLHEARAEAQEELEDEGTFVDAMPREDEQWSQVADILRRRSTESSKKIAKQAKKEQHAMFRRYLRAVEAGEAPDETVSFGESSMTLQSWRSWKQVSAIRQVVRGGLVPHLEMNERLQEVPWLVCVGSGSRGPFALPRYRDMYV